MGGDRGTPHGGTPALREGLGGSPRGSQNGTPPGGPRGVPHTHPRAPRGAPRGRGGVHAPDPRVCRPYEVTTSRVYTTERDFMHSRV